MKRSIHCILALCMICLVCFTNYGVINTVEQRSDLRQAATDYKEAEARLDISKVALNSAEANFAKNREFEIVYTDVSNLVKVLNGVSAITVSAVNVADPAQHFSAGAAWNEQMGSEVQSVTMALTVDDTVSALKLIERLELPIYSISVTEPNIVNVTFLTGGKYLE